VLLKGITYKKIYKSRLCKNKMIVYSLPERKTKLAGFPHQYMSEQVGSVQDLNRVIQTREQSGIIHKMVAEELASTDTWGFKKGEVQVKEVRFGYLIPNNEKRELWWSQLAFRLQEYDAQVSILIPTFNRSRRMPDRSLSYFPNRSTAIHSDKPLHNEPVERLVGQYALLYSLRARPSGGANQEKFVFDPELVEISGPEFQWNTRGRLAIAQRTYQGYDKLPKDRKDPNWKKLVPGF